MKPVRSGGGWPAVWYTLAKARQVGGLLKLWRAMRSKNACKTCALGMGGQAGGMVNEAGQFPEVCKKSLQAMASDMQGAVRADFFDTYSVPQLQSFSPRELEHCGRLTTPVVLEPNSQYYRPIAWDAALDRIAEKLAGISPQETFWYASGRSSNEAGFLLQLFARLYGTNNVNNCSYYCHQASGVGLSSSLGVGTATISLDDLAESDLVFIIGGNPASNHPRLLRTLMQVRRRGGEVIVINPVKETGMIRFNLPSDWRSLLFGSEIASLYVQPHIGGDLALLTALAKRIDELGAVDESYTAAHCVGASEFLDHLRSLSWETLCVQSGVESGAIDQVARRYADAKSAVFAWTMGITHHVHGVENVQAIANLALLRGMVGRPGAGLLPIRGHSNVQGMGSVGVVPQLKPELLKRLTSKLGFSLPSESGLDTLASIEAAADGRLKFGLCLGGNLYGSNPDARYAADALGRLDLLVYLSTTLNTGHAHGLAKETMILPVLARDEEPQPTTQESMFNFVRLSDGGPARHEGPRSEVAILAEIAQRLSQKRPGETSAALDWRRLASTREIRNWVAEVIPGWERLSDIDRTKQEFEIASRRLSKPAFPTADGKATFHVAPLPEHQVPAGQLRLMTVRSEGQFNTVVYEEHDLYRGQERRDVILIHPDDCGRLGLAEDVRVSVHSSIGKMPGILVRPFAQIRPGNALMYYPEANHLVPRVADPRSRTPAFKHVLVWLEVEAPKPETEAAAVHFSEQTLTAAAVRRQQTRAC